MNYLRFTYFELIPKKRPTNVSITEFRKVVSKLRKPYQFKFGGLGLMLYFLIVFTVINCIPVTFYILVIGNLPPLGSVPNNTFVKLHLTSYLIILCNAFFLIVGLFIWSKLPYSLQTIPEKLYRIPPQYLDIIQRLHPENQAKITELQNSLLTKSSN